MHAEIPQLSMDYPEYRLINGKFEVGILQKELKAEHIAVSLNQLLSNNELYSKLVENCKAAKQVYNWQNEEKKLINFYNQLEE